MRRSSKAGPSVAVVLLLGAVATFAQDRPLPADCDVQFLGSLQTLDDGSYRFSGPVTILCGEERIQADRLEVTDQRHLVAEGNVLIAYAGSRVFGSRMTYDLETGRGLIEDAYGQALDDFIFWADSVEKIGPDRLKLRSATVTTCTQPVPYWSFSVSHATLTLDRYAHMWNVRFKTSEVPIVYLPYLVWPIKKGRAAGLLFPEFGSTSNRGEVISQELFIPIGDSADVTLIGRYYEDAGFGGGARVNVLPNRQGQIVFDGFAIRDEAAGNADRYRATYRQRQKFANGFELFADMNFVSDFGYFTDFERDLDLVTSPTILAKVEMARNGSWTSLNVRELRRKQLFSDGSDLTQKTLPEIEWRGRSRRIGRTPFFLSFESSIASIDLEGTQTGQPIDAGYLRADAFPRITVPFSPAPWLDIEPNFTYRYTYWTQSQRFEDSDNDGTEERRVVSADLSRSLVGAGLNVIGPKFFKIFEARKEGGSDFKHVIEPTLSYAYSDDFDRGSDIVLYDDVDRAGVAGNRLTYGVTQRLFMRRPRSRPQPRDDALTSLLSPEPVTAEAREDDPFENYLPVDAPAPEATEDELEGEEPAAEPVEIASFTVSQSRSFDQQLSFADLDRDGTAEASSSVSDVALVGRYNPSASVSVDLRGTVDTLYDQLETLTLSGGLTRPRKKLNFSLVHRNGLGVTPETTVDAMGNPQTSFVDRRDDTTMRITTGFLFWRDRLSLDLDTTYRFDPAPGQEELPSWRWQLRWQTQCCTVYLEQQRQEFGDFDDRRDLYLRVDLTGIGRILKWSR